MDSGRKPPPISPTLIGLYGLELLLGKVPQPQPEAVSVAASRSVKVLNPQAPTGIACRSFFLKTRGMVDADLRTDTCCRPNLPNPTSPRLADALF